MRVQRRSNPHIVWVEIGNSLAPNAEYASPTPSGSRARASDVLRKKVDSQRDRRTKRKENTATPSALLTGTWPRRARLGALLRWGRLGRRRKGAARRATSSNHAERGGTWITSAASTWRASDQAKSGGVLRQGARWFRLLATEPGETRPSRSLPGTARQPRRDSSDYLAALRDSDRAKRRAAGARRRVVRAGGCAGLRV